MAIDKAERNRQNAASRARYEAKAYSKMMLRIRKDGSDGMIKDDISRAAERDGLSVNAWILEAIRDKL
jgi:predicted HicB family RNase H-like nuclease